MRLLPKSLKWRVILLTLVGLTAIGVSVWVAFGRDIIDTLFHHGRISSLRNSPHPVTRGLARGEIGPHTPVEELMATHPPDKVFRSGRFVRISYYWGQPGRTHVVAVDGRLLYASYCFEGRTVFFDHRTADEDKALRSILPAGGLEPLRDEP